jgi:hypothetical protein
MDHVNINNIAFSDNSNLSLSYNHSDIQAPIFPLFRNSPDLSINSIEEYYPGIDKLNSVNKTSIVNRSNSIDQILDKSSTSNISSKIQFNEYLSSDEYTEYTESSQSSNNDNNLLKQSETLFWYNILYAIGSHMIDTFKTMQKDNPKIQSPIIFMKSKNKKVTSSKSSDCPSIQSETVNKISSLDLEESDPYDDPLTKLFCGYWVLYTIATIIETHEISKIQETKVSHKE